MGFLRRHATYANVTASVALFVALGGGAYAVTIAKKNSVTSKSVKNSTIKGVDVRDDSLTGQDVSEGTLSLPPGPKGDKGDQGAVGPAAAAAGGGGSDPAPTSDVFPVETQISLVTPAAGRVLVMLTTQSVQASCTAGTPNLGLYVDSTPVPGTQHALGNLVPSGPVTLLGITPASVPAGSHVVKLGVDCPGGGFSLGMFPARLAGVLVGQ